MHNANFDYLVDAFNALPTIGKKQATRIAYFLINQDEVFIREFIKRITDAKLKIHYCKNCNNFSNEDLCEICLNENRDQHKLCIVATIEDLYKIESTNAFVGRYYVLNGEIDLKNNVQISKNIVKKLIELLNHNQFNEIILATNWTINGEATANFLKKIIKQCSQAKIYRLAMGLPVNSALDYADSETLSCALKNKTEY